MNPIVMAVILAGLAAFLSREATAAAGPQSQAAPDDGQPAAVAGGNR
jgi:hypothetical protein